MGSNFSKTSSGATSGSSAKSHKVSVSKCKKKVIVFVDVGQEIDDELLLLYLESFTDYDIEVVFSAPEGMTDQESMDIWTGTFKPMFKSENPNVKYRTLEEFRKSEAEECDVCIQCSSMKGYSGDNLIVKEYTFLQGTDKDIYDDAGNVVESIGVNAQGSETFLANMSNCLVVAKSSRCAEMRPTTQYLKTLPEDFRKKVGFVGFKLLFGRIKPGIVIKGGVTLSKNIAAGLVNPNVGRGANYNAAQAYLELFGMKLEDFVPGGKSHNEVKWEKCMAISRKYFKKIYDVETLSERVSVVKNVSKGPEMMTWDMEKTLEYLTCINMTLDYMSPGVWADRTVPYYSTFDESTTDRNILDAMDKYMDALNKVEGDKMVGFLNPAYDLYVGYLAITYLKRGEVKMQHALTEMTPMDVFSDLETLRVE